MHLPINDQSENHGLKSVVLVGYQDQGNLGLGYLASSLIQNGFEVHIIDITRGPDPLLKIIRDKAAILVGYSLIFQYYLPVFAKLASFLRERGVATHFTIGGHYPSLRYKHIFDQIPELNSIILFEGEETLVDLVRNLSKNSDWHDLHGIAYRENEKIIRTPLRPLIEDLNNLAFPYRAFAPNEILGKKTIALLASRGCKRNCAFCSIREFYGRAPGKLVRRRSPANVVLEMKKLSNDEKISIFLFQDDDFPLAGQEGRQWVQDFIKELKEHSLVEKIIWKISCRVDEVEHDLFAKLKEAGLYLVYLGIESGTNVGLKTLNKQISVDNILESLEVLKKLDLMFAYGFMLFDPESTFDRVNKNIKFLRKIVKNGKSAVIFCKMLPYAGTPIEKILAAAGRLKGSKYHPDYFFLDPALDKYAVKIDEMLSHWVRGEGSASHHLNMAWHEMAIIRRLFPDIQGMGDYEKDLRSLTKTSNEIVFTVLENYAVEFETGKKYNTPPDTREEAKNLTSQFLDLRNAFIFRHQQNFLKALSH